MSCTALVSGFKKLSVHEGNGIRTTVFLQGCPLRCKWCHNPENLVGKPTFAYKQDKCILCGSCVKACPNGVHSIAQNQHFLDRSKCVACGKCADYCLGQALCVYGKQMTAKQVFDTVMEDVLFYRSSNGGVTFSGGEPLLCADFVLEVQQMLKDQGISCNIDTCGCVPFCSFEKVLATTDVFLYDVKCINEQLHIDGTGVNNNLILQNLVALDKLGAVTEVRVPLIPQWNDTEKELESIGKFVAQLKHCNGVCVLQYHDFAKSKYTSLNLPFAEFGEFRLAKSQAEKILSKYVKVL